ncbi:glycosyltransferase family 4 protein [Geomonas sp.]|uniref:glycosyltransferase family 4 protein n=1 Tax=Geomonas sp. TaxID=2651584 RepID=UPI002B49EB05|nr:glycosyltransferase family 4 protein [Geomonas sp.]HJV37142.1 glycosyltransferase family 4 protein [Geomonas sp.]
MISGKSPITIPGGLGAYAYNVAKILDSLGYKVYILGFSSQKEQVSLDFATLIHFVNPYERLLGLGAVMASGLFVAEMEKVIEQEKPDELIVYSAAIWGVAGTKLKQKLRGSSIKLKTLVGYFTTHKHEYRGHVIGAPACDYGYRRSLFIRAAYLFARTVYSPIESRLLRGSDLVVVHYDSTRNILLSEFAGLDPEKVVKLPYYIDIYERKSELTIGSDAIRSGDVPTVSLICRQDPRKGINTFLKAAKIVRERGIAFNCLVAGAGVFHRHNMRLAKRLGLEGFVSFLGFVDSVDKVLDRTDIYVLPSVEEGSGAISLLEAMKKGVTILTTLCDGIPEDFVDHETAVLVPPNDPQRMAAALEELLLDGNLRAALAANVRRDYAKRFTFEKMQEGLRGLLAQ